MHGLCMILLLLASFRWADVRVCNAAAAADTEEHSLLAAQQNTSQLEPR